jgi:hypothetical protein
MAATATKMKRVAICVFVFSLFVLANQIAGQERNPVWHLITGTVVDERDQPVRDAEVCAWGTGASVGRLPCGQSNENGKFSIRVHNKGVYTIHAEHLERGYPPFHWAFYGKLWQNFPKVNVEETSSPAKVKIKLGPKAGRLILKIIDADTNTPIEKGLVRLCRINERNSCWGISTAFPEGRYELLTPEVPFTIKFETWHGPVPEYHGGVASGPSGDWVPRFAFDEMGRPLEVLQVDLGQRKELTVRLK